MTESIGPVRVDQFVDNIDPQAPQTYEGGFEMKISPVSDGTAGPAAPGFAVQLDAQQFDQLRTALQGVASVDVTRNKADGGQLTVTATASAAAPDKGVVVISDPGPRAAAPSTGLGLAAPLGAMLAVVKLQG